MNPVASVEIDPARPRLEYSKHIFGQFIEHFHRQVYGGVFDPGSALSDGRGFRRDVLDALRELKVPNVRWPGGCFVSSYHWLDGVGTNRSPIYDKAWRVTDPNTFGTDEFIEWCRELGAEPYFCTNAGTGTPEEMSDWVEYTNGPAGSKWADLRVRNGHEDPYEVPFWSIGNENYGDWELGAKTNSEWAHYVAECAKLILRTDPSVSLLAAATNDLRWTLPLLEHAGRYLKYISIHGYWDKLADINEPSPYMECMAKTMEPERQIAEVRAMIEASGRQQVGIAFDEWNLRGWHHPWSSQQSAIAARDLNDDNSTYTMADAVFSACFLNACLRNADKVKMANMAPTVNARGPLFVYPEGIVRRSTFYVMSMYANLLGDHVLDSTVASATLECGASQVPLVDAIATNGHDDRRIVVVLINKSPEESAPIRVRIAGVPVEGAQESIILTGESTDSFNDITHPEDVSTRSGKLAFEGGTAMLLPHSITAVTIETATRQPDGFDWAVGSRGVWGRNFGSR